MAGTLEGPSNTPSVIPVDQPTLTPYPTYKPLPTYTSPLTSTFTFTPIATWTPSYTPTETPLATRTLTATPTTNTQFEVFSNLRWQDTGIRVESGDRLRIEYISGTWSGRDYEGGYIRPGEDSDINYACMPMDQSVTGRNALIGRIDEGDPFLVNLEFDGIVEVEGNVYLRMNDCDRWLFDNDGSVVVTIQVLK